MKSEITTMLGQLLIVNSVYKRTQWYNGNAANDAARAIHYSYVAIGCNNKRPYGTIELRMCKSRHK